LKTLQERKAHCLEAAFAAAALLELNGYPPLVMSLESQDGIDHVVFIFREAGHWGAVGHSRDPGLFGRAPLFRSLRDLAWSYYDPYIDGSSKVTAYQMADLDDTEADIRKRLSWYETDVSPTIEFYRDNPYYNFYYVDGERKPEEIHHDIVKKLNLL
jgi:hypothetical protein